MKIYARSFADPNNFSKLPVGCRRFYLQLSRLFICCNQASENENPALALYQSKARQWAFYLQALARLYKNIHDEIFFKELKDEFKSAEDQLGRIDYYDGLLKKFSSGKDFPPDISKYWEEKKEDELLNLKNLMEEKPWLGGDHSAHEKILDELRKVAWPEAETDKKKIAAVLAEGLADFGSDYDNGKLHFRDLEKGLHEFRRQLRWFSIYTQALDGLIQLREVNLADPNLKKYMTDAVLNSPYNQLPENTTDIEPIRIDAPNFYALSFLINELGELKDSGLCLEAISIAAIETGLCKKLEAQEFALSVIDGNKMTTEEILNHAKRLTDIFLYEENVLRRIRKNLL